MQALASTATRFEDGKENESDAKLATPVQATPLKATTVRRKAPASSPVKTHPAPQPREQAPGFADLFAWRRVLPSACALASGWAGLSLAAWFLSDTSFVGGALRSPLRNRNQRLRMLRCSSFLDLLLPCRLHAPCPLVCQGHFHNAAEHCDVPSCTASSAIVSFRAATKGSWLLLVPQPSH